MHGDAQHQCLFRQRCAAAKFYAGTATAINARIAKNSQALIWQFPRVTLKGGGNPQATGKNTDTMQAFDASANIDTTLTSKQIQLDRVEYFET
jgi:oligoribonuclease NrnB/cAMP/cGMP phosphodiesterase (DHH superfamily)